MRFFAKVVCNNNAVKVRRRSPLVVASWSCVNHSPRFKGRTPNSSGSNVLNLEGPSATSYRGLLSSLLYCRQLVWIGENTSEIDDITSEMRMQIVEDQEIFDLQFALAIFGIDIVRFLIYAT